MNKSDKTYSDVKVQDGATGVQSLLESLINQQLTVPQLIVALKAECRRNSDTTWQALALVDQYFRRGRISHEVFTEIKKELNSLVFSARVETRPSTSSHATSNPATSGHATSGHATSGQESPNNSGEHIAERKEVQPPREPALIKDLAPILPREVAQQNNGSGVTAQSPLPPRDENDEPARSSTIERKMLIATGVAVLVVAALVVVNRIPHVAPAAKPTTTQSDLTTRLDVAKESNSSTQSDVNLPASAESVTVAESEHIPPKPLDQVTNKDHGIIETGSTKQVLPSESVSTTSLSDSKIQSDAVTAHENAAQSATDNAQLHVSTSSVIAAPANEAQTTLGLSFVEDPVIVSTGESTARISVRRAGSTRKELLMHWRTVEGSAKANRDFVGTDDGVLIFTAGSHTADIIVPIVQRSDRQYSDWFEVELITQTGEGRATNSEAADKGSDTRATVVIASKRTTDELGGAKVESGTATPER